MSTAARPPDDDLSDGAARDARPRDRGVRLEIGRVPRRVLALGAVIVMVLAGLVAWWSWPRPEEVAPVEVAVGAGGPSTSVVMLVVSVAGKVRHPGLVRVPPGARVADAIEAAGGVSGKADLGYLNLARKLVDGELIVVGQVDVPGRGPAPGGGPGSVPGAASAPMNLNAATVTELDDLPGVGPVLAQRIVDYRDTHGMFSSIDQLRQVDGIGAAKFGDLKDLVTV